MLCTNTLPPPCSLLLGPLVVLGQNASQRQNLGGSGRRLRAGADPVLGPVKVQLHVLDGQLSSLHFLVASWRGDGVVGANHLDGQAVSSLRRLGHDNVVDGAVSSAEPGQSDANSSLHGCVDAGLKNVVMLDVVVVIILSLPTRTALIHRLRVSFFSSIFQKRQIHLPKKAVVLRACFWR